MKLCLYICKYLIVQIINKTEQHLVKSISDTQNENNTR